VWTNEIADAMTGVGLRCPSDPTNEEWALVEPLIAPARRRRQANGGRARGGQRPDYPLSTGCQWWAIPKDLPPRSTIRDYFDLWSWMARWLASTTGFTYAVARRPRARRARPPPSSTAGASRARKSGSVRQSARLRRGQEYQGQEAERLRLYARPIDACDRACRWRSRSSEPSTERQCLSSSSGLMRPDRHRLLYPY
jgi:hypothetical protein